MQQVRMWMCVQVSKLCCSVSLAGWNESFYVLPSSALFIDCNQITGDWDMLPSPVSSKFVLDLLET